MDTPIKKAIRTNPQSVYSGIAADDLEDKSVTLKVICPELIPHSPFGNVGAGITDGVINLQDRDGKTISSPITTANHLVATWEGSSNSRYPPMVRKGEPVEIFRINNQDKFYWRTSGKGRDFRTTDRVYMEVAAIDPSKPGTEKNDTNTYSAYLDSESKKVGFKTSKANGEVVAFSVEADLAKGTFHISDGTDEPGNRIFLDTGAESGVPVFQVNLSSGATLKFEKDNLFIKVPDKLQIDVGGRIVMNSPLTIFNLDKKGTIIVNALNMAVNTGRDFIISAGGVIGLSAISTKLSGVVIAASMRVATLVKAGAGSDYKAPYVQRPQETPVRETNNSADTNMTGLPYRT